MLIWNSHPEPYELQVWKAFPQMQLVFSLSFVKLLWPFEKITSYAHDQDHVHVHSCAILLHWKIASTPIHPSTNNTPCHAMTISLQKLTAKSMGYTKRNKRCIPKKICHMPTRHVEKNDEKKRCIPKEGMPHAHKACQKKEKRCIPKEGMPHIHKVCQREREIKRKENIAHTKNITREREFI